MHWEWTLDLVIREKYGVGTQDARELLLVVETTSGGVGPHLCRSGHGLACVYWRAHICMALQSKDENGTEISRTEPNRFLYLIRSNSYFFVRLYRFRFRILDISYFKYKSRKRFWHFSTVFYFSTFNMKYFKFKIWFKPNLVNCRVTQPNYRLITMYLRSFY